MGTEKVSKVPDREAVLRIISGFRLMDDEFMTECFRDNKPAVRLVLRIILGKPDLEVNEVRVQEKVGNFEGRSLCVDVLARDKGKLYNIEIQRSDAGSIPERARYHGSLLDVSELEKGATFDELPETYVIFITENDVYRKGLPFYSVERVVTQTGQAFNDRLHIMYVNGKYRGDDDIGKLMRDFSCTSADEMTYNELAERVRYLKEDKGGEQVMVSRVVEEYGDGREAKGRAEGLEKGRAEGLEKGRAEGADRMGALISKLIELNRIDDVKKVSADSAFRDKLFKELGIA